MAKVKMYKIRTSTAQVRKQFEFFYTEKFFNKWMNKYDFPQLNYQQKHYIMKKLWGTGTISCSEIKSADPLLAGLIESGEVDMGADKLIFTPWVMANRYNIYDFPTHARRINTRGVKFITDEALELDKGIVIGWAQKNHKSVYSSIEAKLKELIDVEMKKRLARKSQAQAFLFTFSNEDMEQAKRLQQQLEDDEPYIFVPTNEPDKAKGFSSGAPYIVDKLEQDRQKIENDILTILGVNNVGVGEKKEHLIVDEVNANNEDVQQQSSSYTEELENFFDRVEKAFGVRIDVVDINKEFKEAQDEINEEEDEEDVIESSSDEKDF